MKIAIIAPTEIPARRANTLQVMKMAQALTVQGHDVDLAAPASHPAPEQTWESLARHYGLHHPFSITWLSSNPALRRYDYSWRAVRRARRQNADLVYTRLPQAAALSSQLGIPTILEVHDLPQRVAGPLLFRLFLGGKGACRLVVITQALVNDLEQQFKINLHTPLAVVAPDGVDLERYKQLPSPQNARQMIKQDLPEILARLDPDAFTVGYTGHLYPGRGSGLLLDLAEHLPQVAFLIVGGEPAQVESARVEAMIKGLDNIYLTGFVPNADLPVFQAACDVLLMPYQQKVEASSGGDISRYLSPMKLFEYLACERAIVSSRPARLG